MIWNLNSFLFGVTRQFPGACCSSSTGHGRSFGTYLGTCKDRGSLPGGNEGHMGGFIDGKFSCQMSGSLKYPFFGGSNNANVCMVILNFRFPLLMGALFGLILWWSLYISHRGGSECKCWWKMLPFNCARFPKNIGIHCIKSVWLIGDVRGCRVKSFVLWSLHFSLEWRRWNYETIIHN